MADVGIILTDMKYHHYSIKRLYRKTRSALRARGPILWFAHRCPDSAPTEGSHLARAFEWQHVLRLIEDEGVFRALQGDEDGHGGPYPLV